MHGVPLLLLRLGLLTGRYGEHLLLLGVGIDDNDMCLFQVLNKGVEVQKNMAAACVIATLRGG